MKRFIALSLICLFVLSVMLSGCDAKGDNTKNNPSATPAKQKDLEPTKALEEKIIKVWSYTSELPSALKKFTALHPDFGYEIQTTDVSTEDAGFQTYLDLALAAGGSDAPDIYVVESSYAVKYTQGEASGYAAAYKDLGIDVDNLLKEASIAQYSIDLGTNPEGKLVGLSYQSTAGAFIYRRSIAKDVWGTDDPTTIKATIGPGWDQFLAVAADLKAKGYAICSSSDDIWQAVNNTTNQPWVIGDKLFIDPKREEFIDLAMKLKENDYLNNTQSWTDEWYNDMKDGGKKKVFGYFGPSWLINYVIIPNSGGTTVGEGTYGDWAVCESPVGFYLGGAWVLANKNTKVKDGVAEIIKWITLDTSETGLQYLLANGKLESGVKDAAASATVMKKSDCKIDFLGGQNLFDAYIPAGENANGKNRTKYDESINSFWLDQVREYTDGKKSREQAIADFKKQAADNLANVLE